MSKDRNRQGNGQVLNYRQNANKGNGIIELKGFKFKGRTSKQNVYYKVNKL